MWITKSSLILICCLCLISFGFADEEDNTANQIENLDKTIKQLKKEKAALQLENSNLKKLYTSCTQSVNQFHQKRNACEKLTLDSNKQIDELKEANAQLEIEKGNLSTELKELKLQLNSLVDEITVLKNSAGTEKQEIQIDPMMKEAQNEHAQFAQSIRNEYQRQKDLGLEEAEEANNGPKDIALFCPSSPQVRITDLDRDLINKNICLQLQLGSPELQTRLLLYCDGSIHTDSMYSCLLII